MDTAAAPAEAFIRSRLARKLGSDLSAACDEDNLIADTHFTRNSIDFGDILVVNVVMADDGGCHDCICIQLDCCVNEFSGGQDVPR